MSAAAMLYTAVVGNVSPNAFLAATQTAAQTAPVNLTPGPWTSAQITVPVESAPVYSFPASASPTDAQQTAALRLGSDPLTAAQRASLASSLGMASAGTGLYGTSGPFQGVYFGNVPSPMPASVLISAFKQVFVNPTGAAPSLSWRGTLAARVANTMHAFTSSAALWGSTPAGDRGVPANPAFVEAAPGADYGILLGLGGVALLAYVASRGTAKKPLLAGWRARTSDIKCKHVNVGDQRRRMCWDRQGRLVSNTAVTPPTGLGKLSTNREGLTWEEWRRAAAVSSSTRGAHAAWVRGEDPTEWRAAGAARR